MRVLIILGHPRKDSFCGALAEEFCATLCRHNVPFRFLILADLKFDLHIRHASIHDQTLEPDLEDAREAVAWANHLVFVYPIWWGMMPSLLKGFLDRILLPGFAFRERESGSGYEGILTGKSAHLLTTMDTPPWVLRFILRRPGHRAFDVLTLRFCGVRPVRIRMFGPVTKSTREQRQKWLRIASNEALLLLGERLRGWEAWRDKSSAWLMALRLPFYPMSWLAYTAGAALAVPLPALWRQPVYWWCYAVLFLIEALTVFLNEIFDFETDRGNIHYSPFNGGSRVLVNRRLSVNDLRRGCIVAGAGSLIGFLFVLALAPGSPWVITACLLTTAVLGVGYTAPPLKLSHRCAGEVVVAFTHSLLIIQCGSAVLGGPIASGPVWLLGGPLFFAVLPSIILSALPDRVADKAAGKCTLAVKIGARGALTLSIAATLAAAALALTWGGHWSRWAAVCMGVHALTLITVTLLQWPVKEVRRIDLLLVLALSYILWFVVVPLFGNIR